jgi:hypothetical protein
MSTHGRQAGAGRVDADAGWYVTVLDADRDSQAPADSEWAGRPAGRAWNFREY